MEEVGGLLYMQLFLTDLSLRYEALFNFAAKKFDEFYIQRHRNGIWPLTFQTRKLSKVSFRLCSLNFQLDSNYHISFYQLTENKRVNIITGSFTTFNWWLQFFFNFFIVTVPLSFLSLSAITVLKKIKMIAGGGREGCIQGDYRWNPL